MSGIETAVGGSAHSKRTVTDSSPLKAKEPLPGITLKIRPAHRRVYQLFTRYGSLTDQEALECAKADGWDISPSGLRTARAAIRPPRGAGLVDTGRKRNNSTVWGIDPTVDEPERHR